jgi:hypothetical protein
MWTGHTHADACIDMHKLLQLDGNNVSLPPDTYCQAHNASVIISRHALQYGSSYGEVVPFFPAHFPFGDLYKGTG